MTQANANACRTCRYWESPNDISGMCRVNPPSLSPQAEADWSGIWPETHATDWCGAWTEQPK